MTSYTELIADVPTAAFAQNQTLIAEMESVVERAQRWVVRRMDHDAFRASPVEVVLPQSGVIDAPSGLLELRAVHIRYRSSGWLPLRRRTEEMLTALFASGAPGMPAFYAETDDGYQVYPSPSRDTLIRILYNAEPPLLGPANDTNILTDEYPEVIRAASMREAAIFMGDETLSTRFNTEATDALTAANMALARRRRDETGTRSVETANARGD